MGDQEAEKTDINVVCNLFRTLDAAKLQALGL